MINTNETDVRFVMQKLLQQNKINSRLDLLYFKTLSCTRDYYYEPYDGTSYRIFEQGQTYTAWCSGLEFQGGSIIVALPHQELLEAFYEEAMIVPLEYFSNYARDPKVTKFDYHGRAYSLVCNSLGIKFLIADEYLSLSQICKIYNIDLVEGVSKLDFCIIGSQKYLTLGWRLSQFIGGAWRVSYLDILDDSRDFYPRRHLGGQPIITEIPLPLEGDSADRVIFGGMSISKKLSLYDPLQQQLQFSD